MIENTWNPPPPHCSVFIWKSPRMADGTDLLKRLFTFLLDCLSGFTFIFIYTLVTPRQSGLKLTENT